MDIHPLTPERWDDLETLFGPNGALAGCWCMWWRIKAVEFERSAGAGLRDEFADLVASGRRPGLLAYDDGLPVGWVSWGDRSEFGRLNRSPKLKPIDDERVASIVCFFTARSHRRLGVSASLLAAAVDESRQAGYELAEGYPIDTADRSRQAGDLFTGTLDLFIAAGFEEVERRGGRPIVRKAL